MTLDHILNLIFIDLAVSLTPLIGIIGNLKLKYLNEFVTVFDNILGCESAA
jgi:hypothetical protein